MRHIMILGVVGLFALAQGCASVPTFPTNDSKAVGTTSEFGVLVAKPDVYKGRAIRLAGRLVGVETSEQGMLMLAEWLPFPTNPDEGPTEMLMAQGRRFAVFYPGTLDEQGTLHGNKFLAVGEMGESKSIVTLEGISQSIPYVVARCLHVWETGGDEIEDAPDVENTGYPPMERTYCTQT